MESLTWNKNFLNYVSNPKRIYSMFKDHTDLLLMDIEDCRNYLDGLVTKRVQSVSKEVPYYRTSSDIGEVSLSNLPLLSKQTIRATPEVLLSGYTLEGPLIKRESSGSTGTPLAVWKSQRLFDFYSAISIHELLQYGWTPLDVYYVLHGAGIGNLSPGINPSELSDKIIQNRPNILSCYPSYLLSIIRQNPDSEGLKNLQLKFINTHSEQSSQKERDELESYFGCPVYDEYGSTETGPIAVQCKNKNYHIIEDNVHLEVLDSKGNLAKEGERGEIVITDLQNETMALVRYRVGDIGSLGGYGECGCEWNNFRVLNSLEGRVDDSFKLPSGKIVPPGQMISEISVRDRMAVKEWEIVQEEIDSFRIYVVKGEKFDPSVAEELKDSLLNVLDEPVRAEIKYVDEIRSGNGKRRVYRSLINHD